MKKGKEKVYTAHFVWINSFRSSCDIIQASINDRVDSSVTFSKSIHKSFVCIEVISVHLHKGLAQRIKLIFTKQLHLYMYCTCTQCLTSMC